MCCSIDFVRFSRTTDKRQRSNPEEPNNSTRAKTTAQTKVSGCPARLQEVVPFLLQFFRMSHLFGQGTALS